jgi:small subunit ribosomal protein S2
MSRLPGAVVVIDAKKEYLALREAKKLGISTVGLLDTDSDPDTVDVAIPANDDSIRAIDLILNELADAVAIGKTMISTRPEPKQRPRRVRSKRPALARVEEAEPKTAAPAEATSTTTAEPAPEGKTEQQEPKQSAS